MVLYGPTPSAADLAHNEEARHYAVPKFDGTDPEPYWNCTRNGVTFKVGARNWDAYGNYFSIISSIENQSVEYAMRNLVQPNTSVVDIGSGFGSFTLPFLASGHPVYSFEIDPHFFHETMANIRLNMDIISQEHINCYNLGLWSTETTGDYYNMKKCKFRRLDDVLSTVNDCSYYKVDVEGAELEVMKGSVEFLRRNQPAMWIECHEIFHQGITKEIVAYVKEIGFHGFTIKEYEMVIGTKHLLIAK